VETGINQNIYPFVQRITFYCAITQQERSMNKKISTTPIYEDDLELVKKFRDSKKFKNLAEAMNVIVEYANAQGVLS
jgi:hypothetical protein